MNVFRGRTLDRSIFCYRKDLMEFRFAILNSKKQEEFSFMSTYNDDKKWTWSSFYDFITKIIFALENTK